MKYFITTPIYYVNNKPHIGHAYCTIVCDVIARFKRMIGRDVLFSTGCDEHGAKAEEAAKQKGMDTKLYVEEMSGIWKNLWSELNISYTDFIRTTDTRHVKVVQSIFSRLKETGDIYLGLYEGWYCIPCETFWTEIQVSNGRCPNEWCKREVRKVKEENYFFKLSKYEKVLIEYYEKNNTAILPRERYNEVVSFIKSGLQDICISRHKPFWGIDVPDDPKYAIYVWFDALINYLTVCGYLQDEEKFDKFWPPDVHFVGKDIIRFHCVIWPAMLLSLGLELPKCVFSQGFWSIQDEKISKSKGNVIEPVPLIEELSQELNIGRDIAYDVVRYYLLREIPQGSDGNFSKTSLITRYNSDLANDLGNLLYRTLSMIEKYFKGVIPTPEAIKEQDKNVESTTLSLFEKMEKYFDEFDMYNCLQEIWKVINLANKYVEDSAPWKLARENDSRLNTVIYNLAEVLFKVSYFIESFMPSVAKKIREQIAPDTEEVQWNDLKVWGNVKPKTAIRKGNPLFPRYV